MVAAEELAERVQVAAEAELAEQVLAEELAAEEPVIQTVRAKEKSSTD